MSNTGICLLKMSINIVFYKKLNIRLKRMQVWKRRNMVRKIDRIIPQINVFADFAPVRYVFQKRLTAGVFLNRFATI